MKTKYLLVAAYMIGTIFSSCTKEDITKGITTPPTDSTQIDSTELLLVGRWAVEKYVDSTSMTQSDGSHITGSPRVTITPGVSSEYIELKNTRLDVFHVQADTKKKDGINALHGMTTVECAWWYDKPSNSIILGASYGLVYLSEERLMITEVETVTQSGALTTRRSVTVFLYRP